MERSAHGSIPQVDLCVHDQHAIDIVADQLNEHVARGRHVSRPGGISISVSELFQFIHDNDTARLIIHRLSIYVLESSNSRKLTYFMPPLVS